MWPSTWLLAWSMLYVMVAVYDDFAALWVADPSDCKYDFSFTGLWHARYQAAMLIIGWICFAAFQVRNIRLSNALHANSGCAQDAGRSQALCCMRRW